MSRLRETAPPSAEPPSWRVLRLLTTRAVLDRYGNPPLSNEQAWKIYDSLISNPRVNFAAEPDGLEQVWKEMAGGKLSSPKLWMDAYLAAFAIAGGYGLVTLDTAFTQFRGLDVVVLPQP